MTTLMPAMLNWVSQNKTASNNCLSRGVGGETSEENDALTDMHLIITYASDVLVAYRLSALYFYWGSEVGEDNVRWSFPSFLYHHQYQEGGSHPGTPLSKYR